MDILSSEEGEKKPMASNGLQYSKNQDREKGQHLNPSKHISFLYIWLERKKSLENMIKTI